jgi:hypothetical protein
MPLYPTEEIIWDENVVPLEYYASEGRLLISIQHSTTCLMFCLGKKDTITSSLTIVTLKTDVPLLLMLYSRDFAAD